MYVMVPSCPAVCCLQRAGVSFKVDNRLPNLVNLNEDPQLSEMLLYVINEGTTVVGQKSPTSEHEIQLTGALVAMNHWWVGPSRVCDAIGVWTHMDVAEFGVSLY